MKFQFYGQPPAGRLRRLCARVAIAATGLLLAVTGTAAPIATNTALPLGANGIVLREQLVYIRASDELNGLPRDMRRFEMRTTMGYGFTRKLAVFATLPYASIDSDIAGTSTDISGLGDAAAFARYEVFNRNGAGRTLRVAPYLGMRFPTGREGRTGDGSTDVFGGVVMTVASVDWGLDSQVRYDLNREADGFDRGDVLSLESSFQYRLAPRAISAETGGFLFGVVELAASWAERNEAAGITQANSGGFQLFLTPGVQYASRRWMLDFGVRLPVVSDLNGTALEPDAVVVTSLRVNF